MNEFRVFIYADGLVLPLVLPLNCKHHSLADRLQQIFAHDLIATRAEIWDGSRMIMQIDAAGIAALAGLAEHDNKRSFSAEHTHH